MVIMIFKMMTDDEYSNMHSRTAQHAEQIAQWAQQIAQGAKQNAKWAQGVAQ